MEKAQGWRRDVSSGASICLVLAVPRDYASDTRLEEQLPGSLILAKANATLARRPPPTCTLAPNAQHAQRMRHGDDSDSGRRRLGHGRSFLRSASAAAVRPAHC